MTAMRWTISARVRTKSSAKAGLTHPCAKCGHVSTFHKITDRRAYACAYCGVHIYPCAGTIFQDSRTSLMSWFYAIFLFVATRHGVSGKELERQLGCTYKTAWRMGHQVRLLMAKADPRDVLSGHIEVDEAYIGGKRTGGKRGRGTEGKTILMGLKQRGGRIEAQVIPNVRKNTLRDVILAKVEPGSIISTDELMSYASLGKEGFTHGTVRHSQGIYARHDDATGEVTHTNHVESFWRLFKKSVDSTHIHVSPKYMNRYLREFTFRSNYRAMENAMFDLLIAAL